MNVTDYIYTSAGRLTGRILFSRDKRNRWRWTLIARNGNKVACSAEGDGFAKLSDARRNLKSARRLLALI